MMFQNKKSSSSWFQYCLQLKISLFSPFICYQKSSKKIFICSSSYIVMVIKSALLYCVDNFRSQHLKFWKNWLFAFWTTLKIKTLLTYLIHNVFHTTRWTRIPKVFFTNKWISIMLHQVKLSQLIVFQARNMFLETQPKM
jgi:hypothetical protein